ncbi:MAG: hypothetical protein HWN67_14635 [Candidatus Helarchaeota archaeon]|nr:hypothetical protein [Candidatus Helarchaeota archaeon]
MEGKYIALIIVSTVVPAAIIAGVIGGTAIYKYQQKENLKFNLILLSLIPVDFTVEITSDASWSGYYSIDGSYDFVTGSNNQIYSDKGLTAQTLFILDSSGFLTLRILIDDKEVYSKTINSVGNYVSHDVISPRLNLIILAFLI